MTDSKPNGSEDYRWPNGIDSLPPGEDVVLLLHGLMGICHNPEGFCEVGILNRVPHHNFGIYVYEGPLTINRALPPHAQEAILIEAIDAGDAGEPIRIYASDPRPEAAGVSYYQQDLEPTNPEAPPYADKDMRWLVDFEQELYKCQLRKQPELFAPRLRIENGIIHVAEKTRYWYVLKSQDDERPARQIGYVVGANIYLKPGGHVGVLCGDREVRLKASAGKKYNVLIDNSCPQDVCAYDPASTEKERRNDFYLYYTAFRIPDGRSEYELIWDNRPRSSDDAPCGATGFGGGGGLDEPRA